MDDTDVDAFLLGLAVAAFVTTFFGFDCEEKVPSPPDDVPGFFFGFSLGPPTSFKKSEKASKVVKINLRLMNKNGYKM